MLLLSLTTIACILGLSNGEIARGNVIGLHLIKNSFVKKIQQGFDESQLWINTNKKKLMNKFDQMMKYKFENINIDDEYSKCILTFDI